jgi:hypothetical protein
VKGRELACLAFVTAAATYFAAAPVADNDLWGHVLFGRHILDARSLPAANGYSYTAPDHPWINHEILAECLFAFLYEHLGSLGLLFFKITCGLLTVLVMKKTAADRGAEPFAWALAVALAASVMSWGFLIRPQLLTLLATALLWDRLHAHAAGRAGRTVALLPVLFLLWVNTHGGVLAGFAILAAYCLLAAPGLAARERIRAGLVLLGCGAALFVNPYGLRLVSFLLHDVTLSRSISEWGPIPLLDGSHGRFKLAVAACLLGMWLHRASPFWESAVVALAAAAALRHQRHAPLFAILAAPLLARTFSNLLAMLRERLPRPRERALSALLVAGLLAVAAWQTLQVASLYRSLHGQIFVSPLVFPVDAVRFISRNDLRGNLLVPFDWGEYALWHLYPRCRVSVDGRYTTAYPLAVLEQSDRFQAGAAGWRSSLSEATIALVERRQPVVQAMFAEPGWQYVYSDATALVFVRKEVDASRAWNRNTRDDLPDAFFFP